jgi:hypothetical protein
VVGVKVEVLAGVGIPLAVPVGVREGVTERVEVKVAVEVTVGLLVRVGEKVKVVVLVGVLVRVGVEVKVLVLVGVTVGLELPVPGITIKYISLGWRVTLKVLEVVWAVPAMAVTALGAGFTVPLIERLVASCETPPVLPDGNITQASPEEAGVNPVILIVAVSLVLGLLFTMKRVKFPELFIAA